MDLTLFLKVETKDAEKLYSVLTSEKPVTNDRAGFDIKKEKDSIAYEIWAKDATALRAILNSITTNLQIFEKSAKLDLGVKNE